MKYSQERRESVLKKLLPPQSRSVNSVSEEENICTATLYGWRNTARAEGRVMPKSDKRSVDQSSDEKFAVVVETAGLNETQLAETAALLVMRKKMHAIWGKAEDE